MKTVNVKALGDSPYVVSLESEDVIGKGSYAEVRVGYSKEDNTERLAIKIFELGNSKKMESGMQELKIVCNLYKHPNLVEYKRVKVTSQNRLYLIMEKCDRSLSQEIRRRKDGFSEREVWNFLTQFAKGYKVLYGVKVVHRDIKPDNILIGLDGKFKITDFGLSDLVSENMGKPKKKGSLCFMCPELLKPSQHGFGSSLEGRALMDVYSLGVTVFFMCFGQYPYVKDLSRYHSLEHFLQDALTGPLIRPKGGPSYSQELLTLIESMLEREKEKRCTWEYIFYRLLTKEEFDCQRSVLRARESKYELRVIEISDALLKNLSNLDLDLYQSISKESVIVIDHIECDVLWKRHLTFYCDQIYWRLSMLVERQRVSENSKILGFKDILLAYNVHHAGNLAKNFDAYYEKIERSELVKVLESKKYLFIRQLIHQDYESLKQEKGEESKSDMRVMLYEMCTPVICELYALGLYEECLYVYELEKWVGGQQNCMLCKLRKNENMLAEFNRQTGGCDEAKLKERIGKEYLHYFTVIDQKQ